MAGSRLDAIVLGAGIEGLAAAATLARGGRRVALVERQPVAGGTAAREEFHPGFRAPGLLHEAGGLRRRLLAPLELERHGLRWSGDERPLFVPEADGPGFLFHRDPALMRPELPAERGADVAAYEGWRAFVERVRPIAESVLDAPPPELEDPRPAELLRLARTGLALRRLGERELLELMRTVPASAADLLGERFAFEPLRVALAAPALTGSFHGPRAPGTGALVLLRECAAGPEPAGGASGLVDALEGTCRALGVAFHLETEVAGIAVERGVVRGVVLGDGAELAAPRVLSALDLRRTLLERIPPGQLPPSTELAAASWRTRGGIAVLRLACERAPSFRGREGKSIERVCTAGSLVSLERTADGLKYGALPAEPWLDVAVPSLSDDTLAPEGQAVVTALVHGVPATLEDGWSDAARERLVESALGTLDDVAPGLRESVLGLELLAPPDVEARHGTSGGHLFEGELGLDQLWVQRPSLALSRYATPVEGLFLASGAAHPGGPFLGGAGVLAADAALRHR